MRGIPLGQRAEYRGELYEALPEMIKNTCWGCCWWDGHWCCAPAGAHLFDCCASNHVIYKKVKI